MSAIAALATNSAPAAQGHGNDAHHPQGVGRIGKGGPRLGCPHCGSRAKVRSSKQLSALYREVYLCCSNAACGHVFVCGLEALRTLSPSAIPNPEISLPLADTVRTYELFLQLSQAMEESTP